MENIEPTAKITTGETEPADEQATNKAPKWGNPAVQAAMREFSPAEPIWRAIPDRHQARADARDFRDEQSSRYNGGIGFIGDV